MGDQQPELLSIETARHVAKLARLALSEDDLERSRAHLAAVIGHVAKLNELDVTDVEPLDHPIEMTNRLGDDSPMASLPIVLVLRNAPANEGRYLTVPKVLGDKGG